MKRFFHGNASSDGAAPGAGGVRRSFWIIAGFLFLAAYSALLLTHFSRSVGGADSSGYANGAKLLRQGRLVEPVRALDVFSLDHEFGRVFRPLGFTWGLDEGLQAPVYPLGMSFHELLAAAIFGWSLGPYLVSPAAAIIGLVLMYFLARGLGLSRLYASAGAVVLALMPAYVFIALQPLSDVLATTWILAAFLAALLARRRPAWAVLSGAALGVAFLVRPSNALFVLPLLFALPAKPKAIALFGAGAFPFAAFWLTVNRFVYGGWLVSGYRTILGRNMALSNFLPRFLHYGYWLVVMLTPLILLAWLALPAIRKVPIKDRLMLAAWFLPLFIFYCCYGPHDAWWYIRFLLPGMPALILAALLAARSVFSGKSAKDATSGKTGTWAAVAAGLCLAVVAVNEARLIPKLEVLGIGRGENVFRQSCRWAEQNWPEKSLVFSMHISGSVAFYTKFIPCRYDVITSGQFGVLRKRAAERGYQLYAMLLPYEEKVFQKLNLGAWDRIGNVRHVGLWKMRPD